MAKKKTIEVNLAEPETVIVPKVEPIPDIPMETEGECLLTGDEPIEEASNESDSAGSTEPELPYEPEVLTTNPNLLIEGKECLIQRIQSFRVLDKGYLHRVCMKVEANEFSEARKMLEGLLTIDHVGKEVLLRQLDDYIEQVGTTIQAD